MTTNYYGVAIACVICGISIVFIMGLAYMFVFCICHDGLASSKPSRRTEQNYTDTTSVQMTPLTDPERIPHQHHPQRPACSAHPRLFYRPHRPRRPRRPHNTRTARRRSASVVSTPPPVYVRDREEDNAGLQPPPYEPQAEESVEAIEAVGVVAVRTDTSNRGS